MAMTLQARLARLEALEKAVQFPTHIEYHDCIDFKQEGAAQ